MKQSSDIPFNIKILHLTNQKLSGLKPVRVGDIFDGATGNLHEEGLFSISIFGKVGDERRSLRFSYIDVKIPIFHPIIYFALNDIKKLYSQIMQGAEYATWSDVEHDFVRSNPVEGSTGFEFFVSHWQDIVFKPSASDLRIDQAKLIEQYKAIALTSKVVVIPAGLRDLEIGEDGHVRKDEINDFYARLISISNAVSDTAVSTNLEFLNPARIRLQETFNNIYLTLESMLKGKHKLFLSKWASRKIQNGTRNVITALKMDNPILGHEGNIESNHTAIGLYQMMKAALPVTRYELRSGYLSQVFISQDLPVTLVDPKTLKSVKVNLSTGLFDKWTTDEGLDKLISGYSETSIRHNPIKVGDHYLALIYKGANHTFKIFQDIDDLPEDMDPKEVSPITWTELFYISTVKRLNTLPAFVTRYPITGIGSIYPSMSYVKTTTSSETRLPLDDDWVPMDASNTFYQFPLRGGAFVNAISPMGNALKGLGAD